MISEVEYADQTPNLCGAVARYLCHPVFAAIGMLIDPFSLEQLGVDSRAGAGIGRASF